MGNQIIPVKVTELLYQLNQACKDSQPDRDTGEVMDQLNTEVEAIMPLIQKYMPKFHNDLESYKESIFVYQI